MKRIFIGLIVFIITLIGIVIFKNNFTKEKTDPIEDIMTLYNNYTFHDIKTNTKNGNIFQIEENEVNYDLTGDTLKIELSDNSILVVRLIESILHIVYNNIDYTYTNLGKVDKIMRYDGCNCDTKCTKVIALTKEGTLYYIDLDNDLSNLSDKNLFKQIDSEYLFSNIGYTNNLLIPNACGINGIVATTGESNIILDNNFLVFNQDYYSFIGDEDKALYIYPDGSIKIYNNGVMSDIDLKITEAFLSEGVYYVIDINGYLYKIEDEKVSIISNQKIIKIGYKEKDDVTTGAILIYEDATAKVYTVDENYPPLK